MNKISVINSTIIPMVDMGQIWVRENNFYIVAKRPDNKEYVLVCLQNGNIWSSESLFGDADDKSEFSLFKGTLTLQTNN